MWYDEQAAAYAASRVLANSVGDDAIGLMEIGRSLKTNTQGVISLIARFLKVDRWDMRDWWSPEYQQMLSSALEAYRRERGLPPGSPINPGRPLLPEELPPRPEKPKPPSAPPDLSEYGIAKAEYLAALERLKAAKAKLPQQ